MPDRVKLTEAQSFWSTPFDEARFNSDYCRAMLMALVIHVFHKDWGIAGSIGVLTLCAGWAMLQGYSRYRALLASNAKGK